MQEIDWSKTTIPVEKLASLTVGNNPSYIMTFHKDGKQVAALDWNGPEMKFTGDLDEASKLLFELLAQSFKGRLEQERAAERDACLKACMDLEPRADIPDGEPQAWWEIGCIDCTAAIRARGNHAYD